MKRQISQTLWADIWVLTCLFVIFDIHLLQLELLRCYSSIVLKQRKHLHAQGNIFRVEELVFPFVLNFFRHWGQWTCVMAQFSRQMALLYTIYTNNK